MARHQRRNCLAGFRSRLESTPTEVKGGSPPLVAAAAQKGPLLTSDDP